MSSGSSLIVLFVTRYFSSCSECNWQYKKTKKNKKKQPATVRHTHTTTGIMQRMCNWILWDYGFNGILGRNVERDLYIHLCNPISYNSLVSVLFVSIRLASNVISILPASFIFTDGYRNQYRKICAYIIIYICYVVFISFTSLHPRKSGDVHPKRKRHQLVLRGQRYARTAYPFHLVQGIANLQHRRQRWSSTVPGTHPTTTATTTATSKQQQTTDEFLWQIFYHDISVG